MRDKDMWDEAAGYATIEDEINSLIEHNQFHSKNARSNTLIATDSDTACLESTKKGIRRFIDDAEEKQKQLEERIISC